MLEGLGRRLRIVVVSVLRAAGNLGPCSSARAMQGHLVSRGHRRFGRILVDTGTSGEVICVEGRCRQLVKNGGRGPGCGTSDNEESPCIAPVRGRQVWRGDAVALLVAFGKDSHIGARRPILTYFKIVARPLPILIDGFVRNILPGHPGGSCLLVEGLALSEELDAE